MLLIVTRPAPQALPWVQRLQALGQPAQALPLIAIGAPQDTAPVRAAWAALEGCALLMFVSANAVQQFFALRPAGALWPPGLLAGATGPGTAAALRAQGLAEDAIVEPPADAPSFDSEALWARLSQRDWAGRRVLVVRGEDGRDWLAETLRGRGAEVGFVAAYRRLAPTLDSDGQALLAAALARPDQHLWHFSSSEAVLHLQALAPAADWRHSGALASHPRIAQAARALGFGRVDQVAPRPEAVAAAAARRAPAAPSPSIQSPRL